MEIILDIARRLLAGLRRLVVWLVVACFAYMAVTVLVQVLGRYVFNYSIGWASESATFAQIWMVLLAAGLAMRDRMHVGVDAVANLLPIPLMRAVTLVVAIGCAWFLWQAIVGSFSMIRIGRIQTSPAIGLPMWIPYLSLPIGLAYFALELVLTMVDKLRDPLGSTQPAKGTAA
ncbi:MAG: TRAP transporter small permease [Ectothiorhodospiraceae bacterium]|nr:TRAP transporter small permease [Ectothiorhodospiraceae bacterium]